MVKHLEGRPSIVRNDKGKNALGHGGHNIAIVMRNDALEGRDSSLHLGLGDEAKDAQLCQSSVVDLGPEALLLLLFGHILVAAKGVVKIESTAGDELGIKGGEFTDLTALHVVLVASNLAPLWFIAKFKSL